MIEVNLKQHHSMFRRAWRGTLGVQSLGLEESRQKWLQEFGCKMVEDKDNKFVTAVFEHDEDYTAFLLRWS